MLNSLARALAPEYIDKAIQMVDSLQTDGLVIHRDTYVVLIQACTQESRIDTAHDLYWYSYYLLYAAPSQHESFLFSLLCLQPLPINLSLETFSQPNDLDRLLPGVKRL